MTRTARAAFPRAINRDRSESKSGLDKSIPKNGAGPHSWGSLADEREHEFAAMYDEELEMDHDEVSSDNASSNSETFDQKKPGSPKKDTVLTSDELENAKKFRKNALKTTDIDLSAIARTSSALSTSPKGRSAIPIATDAETQVMV